MRSKLNFILFVLFIVFATAGVAIADDPVGMVPPAGMPPTGAPPPPAGAAAVAPPMPPAGMPPTGGTPGPMAKPDPCGCSSPNPVPGCPCP